MSPKEENSSELPFLGHAVIFERLAAQLVAGQLPQSLLFAGPEGIGKRQLGLHLAQALLCSQRKSESFSPCENCQSCHLLGQQRHPDFIQIQPEGGRIKIEMIRELKKSLQTRPFLGTKRVILIDQAHLMNNASANALLKSIEEPPANTHFLLISSAPGLLLKTIISRCQKVWFGPLTDADLSSIFLKAQANPGALPRALKALSDEKFPEILKLTQGSLSLALEFSELFEHWGKIDPWPETSAHTFSELHEKTQAVLRQDLGPVLLKTLLFAAHQKLCQGDSTPRRTYQLLIFSDKLLEILAMLRQNLNLNIQITNLLMFLRSDS